MRWDEHAGETKTKQENRSTKLFVHDSQVAPVIGVRAVHKVTVAAAASNT